MLVWIALLVILTACGRSAATQPPAPMTPASDPGAQASATAPAPRSTSASPCETDRRGSTGQDTAGTLSASDETIDVDYDEETNTIVMRKGSASTLAALSRELEQPELLRQLTDGEWLLAANLEIEEAAELRIAAPDTHWLKLHSGEDGFVSIKVLGGALDIDGVCVSSWDTVRNSFDENYADGRSFVLARDGAQMNIRRSELRYLGYDANESYGLAWRLKGTRGEIIDSILAYNYYGLYSYEVSDLVILGNEVHHSIRYGIDPHTNSNRLLIEDNISHNNGKHGIILAEKCSDSVIRNNVVYSNTLHGIVLYQRSNNNLVENNRSYNNGEQGININNSSNNTIRNNSVENNNEDGIGVGQKAGKNEIVGNEVRANRQDGITIFSKATGTVLRDNSVSDNQRYGIYVKSDGNEHIEENEIFSNAVGVFLNGVQAPEDLQQTNQIRNNVEADVHADDQQDADDEKDDKR
jgi:parallel beta-helix repeat protein